MDDDAEFNENLEGEGERERGTSVHNKLYMERFGIVKYNLKMIFASTA